jgi:hypothetical protein
MLRDIRCAVGSLRRSETILPGTLAALWLTRIYDRW